MSYTAVDLFCGVGGLTHGLHQAGIHVAAGIDADPSCKFAYETNTPNSRFIEKKIEDVTVKELRDLYPEGNPRVLVGCAPCQPYSSYNRTESKENQWDPLRRFAGLIEELKPDVVSMENVTRLKHFRNGELLEEFLETLRSNNYYIHQQDVDCAQYNIPQLRKRLVILASRLGEIKLPPPIVTSTENYSTVASIIKELPKISAGQADPNDKLHYASRLSDLNMRRMKASKAGGTWHDWPEELQAACHKKHSGRFYSSVYGRMEWTKPAPTITTQCYGFGNGRFGHPEQDRAISLREAALLQTFPPDYQFIAEDEELNISATSRHIGNAVPVALGRVIGEAIVEHLNEHIGK
ncbi:MAG: DNA cytosine methyltransferase [Anaerolinea sp.]|nr:DNA cytosine methyltransferase [Anaerolinea sp.]